MYSSAARRGVLDAEAPDLLKIRNGALQCRRQSPHLHRRLVVADGGSRFLRAVVKDRIWLHRIPARPAHSKRQVAVEMNAVARRHRRECGQLEIRVRRLACEQPPHPRRKREPDDAGCGALGKGGSRWLPVRQPGAYAGDVFRTLARSHGIVLKKATVSKDYRGGVVLAQIESDPLWDILRAMLKFSNNLIAETVGMAATEKLSGKPKSLADSAAKMSRWASRRFDTKGTLLVDHSGLGEDSKMTADDLVSALVEARHRGLLRPLLKPIPMRDSQGRPDRSSPIHVDAKTGTLNFVSGLAGFVTAADGTELAFAIFAADTEARDRIPREARERPPGARGWNARAKTFQMRLISRWGALYGS
mgnify:CR=1 FL=1